VKQGKDHTRTKFAGELASGWGNRPGHLWIAKTY